MAEGDVRNMSVYVITGLSMVKMLILSALLGYCLLLYFYTKTILSVAKGSKIGTYIPYAVFCVCGFGLILQVIGFLAALFRTRWIFRMYAIASIVIAILFLLPAVFFGIFSGTGCGDAASFHKSFKTDWEFQFNTTDGEIVHLEVIQHAFKCCGFDGYKEYATYHGNWAKDCQSYTDYECATPMSCCAKDEDVLMKKCVHGTPGKPAHKKLLHQNGCHKTISSTVCLVASIGLGISSLLFIAEIVCIVFGFLA